MPTNSSFPPFRRQFRESGLLSALLLIVALSGEPNAAEHDLAHQQNITGFWLWAGLTVMDQLPSGSPLYVYQGLLTSRQTETRFIRKGLYPHAIGRHPLFPTLRLEGDLPDTVILQAWINQITGQWQQRGVDIAGIQLDFDAATAKLLQYGRFLSEVRSLLPKSYALSITGLGDWLTNGDLASLKAIINSTDEVIFQLYQGRKPLAGIDSTVENLVKLDVPFKVGLLDRPDNTRLLNKLSNNRHFRGAVLFLQR